jgi:transposase
LDLLFNDYLLFFFRSEGNLFLIQGGAKSACRKGPVHRAKINTAAFKVKIALEAIKGQRTINEIATHYGVHPTMVTQWKKQAIESLPDVFSTRRERDAQEDEALKAELYQQIGQLKVEIDWLKKKSGLLN